MHKRAMSGKSIIETIVSNPAMIWRSVQWGMLWFWSIKRQRRRAPVQWVPEQTTILMLYFFLLTSLRRLSTSLSSIKFCTFCLSRMVSLYGEIRKTLQFSFSITAFRSCSYHFSVDLKLHVQLKSQCNLSPTQSCLRLYSFCTIILHTFKRWLLLSPPFLQTCICS